MRKGLPHQNLHGLVVEHVATVVDQAVLAMGGEGVQGHVGNHAQVRILDLQGAHRPLRQALGIPGFPGILGLLLGRGDRKQGDGRHAQHGQIAGQLQQQIDAQALHAGHGGHRLALALAFQHEHRLNEIVDREARLAHQAAGKIVAAHAPLADPGETAPAGIDTGHATTPVLRRLANEQTVQNTRYRPCLAIRGAKSPMTENRRLPLGSDGSLIGEPAAFRAPPCQPSALKRSIRA